jgi:hypothetical protein
MHEESLIVGEEGERGRMEGEDKAFFLCNSSFNTILAGIRSLMGGLRRGL